MTTPQATPQRVTVTDIDIPFMSMVIVLVKWALAAVPALLLLTLFGVLAAGTLNAAISGIGVFRQATERDTHVSAYDQDVAQWRKDCRQFEGLSAAPTGQDGNFAACGAQKAKLQRLAAALGATAP